MSPTMRKKTEAVTNSALFHQSLKLMLNLCTLCILRNAYATRRTSPIFIYIGTRTRRRALGLGGVAAVGDELKSTGSSS